MNGLLFLIIDIRLSTRMLQFTVEEKVHHQPLIRHREHLDGLWLTIGVKLEVLCTVTNELACVYII